MKLEATAVGGGYIRVYVNSVQVSQHMSEREAFESAVNAKLQNPASVVTYVQSSTVRITLKNVPTPVPVPVPVPVPAPTPVPDPTPVPTVKAGTLPAWKVRPSSILDIGNLIAPGVVAINRVGATYDAFTKRLYVMTFSESGWNGEGPFSYNQLHVFGVK